eukprot:COSAG02_NODE_23291_length_723_cov_1.016026_1_plen_50_part_10
MQHSRMEEGQKSGHVRMSASSEKNGAGEQSEGEQQQPQQQQQAQQAQQAQ